MVLSIIISLYVHYGAMSGWRSGRACAFADKGREFDSRSIRKGFCESRSTVYRRLLAHTARTYTAYAATHGTPSGEVASHCNPRHKGACNPNSSKDSVSGAQIPASAMVCVGAARNPWTCQDVGIELSRITPIWVVRQGVTDAVPTG